MVPGPGAVLNESKYQCLHLARTSEGWEGRWVRRGGKRQIDDLSSDTHRDREQLGRQWEWLDRETKKPIMVLRQGFWICCQRGFGGIFRKRARSLGYQHLQLAYFLQVKGNFTSYHGSHPHLEEWLPLVWEEREQKPEPEETKMRETSPRPTLCSCPPLLHPTRSVFLFQNKV